MTAIVNWKKALSIVVSIVVSLFALTAKEALSFVMDKIVAVVNGEVITQREIAQLLNQIFEKYKKEYTGQRLMNKMAEAEDMVMEQLVDDKLLLSEAKRQGIEVTDKEIEDRLRNIKGRFQTEGEFRGALAEQSISLSELKEQIKNDVIKSKYVRREVGGRLVITPIEVREYYDRHTEDFTEPEKVKVSNIMIKKVEKRTDSEAKFLIRNIRELIKSGKDFAELAKEYSEGPNAKEGGNLGFVERGQMIREIDDIIFSLEVGEVSDVIESPLGLLVFKVVERIPAKIVTFEDAKSEIEDLIYRERIDKNLKKLLKQLRKNAYISTRKSLPYENQRFSQD